MPTYKIQGKQRGTWEACVEYVDADDENAAVKRVDFMVESVNLTREQPEPMPRLERGGEIVGQSITKGGNAICRVIELPANIAKRRGSKFSGLFRVGCYASLLLWPIAWPILLAWASMSGKKTPNQKH